MTYVHVQEGLSMVSQIMMLRKFKVQACLGLIFTRCGAFSRPAQSARVIHTYWKFVTGSLSQHIIIYIFLITCIIFSCRYYQTMRTKLIQLWRGKGSNARTCTSMWSDSGVWYIAEIHYVIISHVCELISIPRVLSMGTCINHLWWQAGWSALFHRDQHGKLH